MPCMDDAQSLPEAAPKLIHDMHTTAGWDGSISHIDQPSLFHTHTLPPFASRAAGLPGLRTAND